MNDELDDLKRDYRAIAAPRYLATRIKASVADSRTRSSFWMPTAVTCTAIVALVWMLPFTTQVTSDAVDKPAKPSLSALKLTKPAVPSPSMSQLRSLTVPSMPARPKPAAAPRPHTNYHFENKTLKEKNDAYI